MVAIKNSVGVDDQSLKELLNDTTCDGLLDQRIRFHQPKQGYRVAIDAVLLAASIPAQPIDRVADFGCGVGGVLLSLCARIPGIVVDGYEVQKSLVRLARYNCSLNPSASACHIIESDIRALEEDHRSYNFIAMNPPYYVKKHHTPSPHATKSRAHIEAEGDLETWVMKAYVRLASEGALAVIHHSDREGDVLKALNPYFGTVDVLRIETKPHQAAKRVIIRGWKSQKKKGITVHQALTLHEESGAYTVEAHKILRNCQAIQFMGSFTQE